LNNKLAISHDPEQINAILNAPGCREEHFPPGYLNENPKARHDVTHVFRRGGFSVIGDGMGWLFDHVGIGTYEGHSSILPEKRGPATLARFRDCMDVVFIKSNALEVFTRCPLTNPATSKLAQALHYNHLYNAEGIWGGGDMEVWSLPITKWAAKNRRHIEKGKWLHAEFERNGALHEEHEDCEMHYQMAGIAIEMALHGNAQKGAHVYNIWAAMAGYDPVEVLCLDPLIMRTVWREDKRSSESTTIDYRITPEGLERI
jgi:hypothetical protein